MAGRFGSLLALALFLLPVAARAEGVDFTVPENYQVAPSPTAADPPAGISSLRFPGSAVPGSRATCTPV
jgi:hypothetical protein